MHDVAEVNYSLVCHAIMRCELTFQVLYSTAYADNVSPLRDLLKDFQLWCIRCVKHQDLCLDFFACLGTHAS